ncbi:MAG: hypothetical protein AMXMBFR12_03890 [Candidatus Babeliales bacterium]
MNYLFMPLFFILALFFHNPSLKAEQLIVQFLKPYPEISAPNTQKLVNKLDKVGKPNRYRTKRLFTPHLAGIFATYGGFLDISDILGEIIFPRKHIKPFVYVIISPKMVPIVRSGNTIDHWELEEDEPVEVYKFEQLYDEELQIHYWLVTQEPIPDTNIVPLESIAIFLDPKYVYVPLGITLFKESPHLILPDIYIKPGFDLNAQALYILNFSHYFGSIIPMYKKDKDRLSRQLTY